MYHKKNNKKRLSAIIAAAVAAVTLATVGSTLAFLVAKTDTIENIFTPSKVSCAVVEDNFTANNTVKSGVKIENTGNTDAFIRAAIVVTWKDAGGNVYGAKVPVAGTDYTISLNEEDWNFVTSDGCYYYNGSVGAGEFTEDLINTCAPVAGKAPKGYTLSVEILADAIQSKPASVAEDAWK